MGATCDVCTYPEDGDHVGVGELVVALEGEQDVGEVHDGGGVIAAEAVAEARTVLDDDVANEAVHPRDERGASGPGPLQVEAGEPREVVGPVELAEEVVAFVHQGLELRGLLAVRRQQVVPAAEHRPHDVVQRRALQEPARHDDGGGGRGRGHGHGVHHLARDDGALRGGGRDLARREEVRGRDAAERAPVGAVRGEADGAVEEEPVRGLLDGAVGEGGAGEQLPRDVGVGGDHHTGLAQRERHEPAPAGLRLGRRRELAVRQAGHERHAAEHGQPPGPRYGGGADDAQAAGPPRPPVPPPGGAARGRPVQERRDDAGHDEDRREAEQAVRVAAFGGQGEVQQPAAVLGRRRHG